MIRRLVLITVSPDNRSYSSVSPDNRSDSSVSPDNRSDSSVSPDNRSDSSVSPDMHEFFHRCLYCRGRGHCLLISRFYC